MGRSRAGSDLHGLRSAVLDLLQDRKRQEVSSQGLRSRESRKLPRKDEEVGDRRVNRRIRKAREEAMTFGDGGNLAYIGALERQLTACENANVLLITTIEGQRDQVAA